MAASAQPKLTAAKKRKLSYSAMAAESDKSARNEALEKALGEGSENIEAAGKFKRMNVEVAPGEYERMRVLVKPAKFVTPKMPTATVNAKSRSEKRAALKARRNRKVNPFDHPLGKCGNVGCKKCSPLFKEA